KSIVLLRNTDNKLPLANETKVYFVDYASNNIPTAENVYMEQYEGLTFVTTPDEADIVLLWIKPAIRPLFPADDSPLRVNLSSSGIDVDYVNALTASKPTVIAINYANPFVIDEIYNVATEDRFLGVLATFGVQPEA